MAIKVNGTTVIDDSRNLSNVGGIKTVNGNSLLGSGDIEVGAALYAFPDTSNYTSVSVNTWYQASEDLIIYVFSNETGYYDIRFGNSTSNYYSLSNKSFASYGSKTSISFLVPSGMYYRVENTYSGNPTVKSIPLWS